MVGSCSGHKGKINRTKQRGGLTSGSDFFTTEFPSSTTTHESPDVMRVVASSRPINRQAMA